MFNDKVIVNESRFRNDIQHILPKSNCRISLDSPEKRNLQIIANNYNHLQKEIISLAKEFPHRRIALTYKINSDSSISIEVHPVTESA